MVEPPAGTVTLLFADVEGSTRLLQRVGDAYAELLMTYRELLRAAFAGHGGYEVDTEGDGFFVVFARAKQAIAAAADAQTALAAHRWPHGGEVRVRMGLHTGEPLLIDGVYIGLDVHQAARVMAAGWGGQVLLTQSTRDLLEETAVLDLGVHRLKDLSSPQRLFQLRIDGLRSEFPALRTLENRPTNLPVQPTPLIGRERELEALALLLRREDVQLVTVTGSGGVGKTRLALQAAANAIEGFPDGVFFVALAPVRDASLVIPTLMRTLGLREQADESPSETVATHLQEKKTLLVLDNLEQVVDSAAEVATLLAAAADVRVLATSRAPLRVAGEHLYAVPPLALPDVNSSEGGAIRRSEAVRLFISRAGAVRPGFELTDDNASAVANVCARLDGLPLAIELAAARARVLSPQALVRRLDRQLSLLTGGSRDRDERQQTIQATIAWSYELLSAAERRFFARLGVFIGGCRLEAAEAVCNPDGELGIDVFDGLSSLVEQSLLSERDDPDGEPRFSMLEAIREFALARLAEDERSFVPPATRLRHASYFADLTAAEDPRLRGPDQLAAIERFEIEHPNIRAALAFADQAALAHLSARLVGATYYFWTLQGHVSEGITYASRAVDASAAEPDDRRLPVLRALAALHAMNRAPERARPLADEVEAISAALDDPEAMMWALHLKGYILGTEGDLPGSVAARHRCLDLARTVGDPWFQWVCTGNLGDLALKDGRFEEALALSEEAMASAEELGYVAAIITDLSNRAMAMLGLGRSEAAEAGFVDVMRHSASNRHLEGRGWAAVGLAAVAIGRGAVEDAALLLGFVDAMHARTGYALEGFELARYEKTRQVVRERLDEATLKRLRANGAALAAEDSVEPLLNALGCLRLDALA